MSDIPQRPDTNEHDGTIRMIDLVVILFRFRAWIVGITLAGVILSSVYFWILPKFNVVRVAPETTYTTQVTIGVVNSPKLLDQYFDTRTGDLVAAWFQNLSLLVPVFRETMVVGNSRFRDGQFDEAGSLETYLQDSVLGKTLKVTLDQTTVMLKVTMEDTNAPRTEEFLTSLADHVKKQVTLVMQKRIQAARKALDDALSALASSGATQERILAQAELLQKKSMLDQLFADADFPFQQQGDMVVLEQINGRGGSNKSLSPEMMIVILSLSSLMGAVFLAFLLEYLRQIRRNVDDMAKIRSVLEKTPRNR